MNKSETLENAITIVMAMETKARKKHTRKEILDVIKEKKARIINNKKYTAKYKKYRVAIQKG